VITRRLFAPAKASTAERQALPAQGHPRHLHGHGAGTESYAIIGQERIGQLLSSMPHDRRAIIEEAAGLRASRPRSGWPSCAWKAPSRTWRVWTTSSMKSRGR